MPYSPRLFHSCFHILESLTGVEWTHIPTLVRTRIVHMLVGYDKNLPVDFILFSEGEVGKKCIGSDSNRIEYILFFILKTVKLL